ncbi:MAG: hypothetical protein WCL06_14645 [Bacteroidota bacterium]
MKKLQCYKLLFFMFVMLSATALSAQSMKDFTWDSYKTKFSVPSDFRITSSTGEKWSGTNDDITLSIYPRKNETLSHSEMQTALYNWTVDNNVKKIGDIVELDDKKLNGYWGYLYEGDVDGFPVGTMLIVDPDYPNISIYIWVSYREGLSDTVIKMLMSFTPS